MAMIHQACASCLGEGDRVIRPPEGLNAFGGLAAAAVADASDRLRLRIASGRLRAAKRLRPPVAAGWGMLCDPIYALVNELSDRYNTARIDELGDCFARASEGERSVRMLVEQVGPLAEGRMDLPFSSCADGA